MDANERLNEVANLRFAFQSKSRLRLEFLGELSKILRIHGQSVSDEVLSTIVVAIPEELPGEGFASGYHRELRAEDPRPPTTDRPPEKRPPETDEQRPPMTKRPPEVTRLSSQIAPSLMASETVTDAAQRPV